MGHDLWYEEQQPDHICTCSEYSKLITQEKAETIKWKKKADKLFEENKKLRSEIRNLRILLRMAAKEE